MKHHKEVIRLAYKEKVVDHLTCDVCGRASSPNRAGWEDGPYDATEVRVELRRGSSYPEAGWGTTASIDICPECFENKLIPWVEGFGHTTIKFEEWDW